MQAIWFRQAQIVYDTVLTSLPPPTAGVSAESAGVVEHLRRLAGPADGVTGLVGHCLGGAAGRCG
jgi:hypothetical protein